MKSVLVATLGRKTMVQWIGRGPSEVQWAAGIRAKATMDGVSLEGVKRDGAVPASIGYGRAFPLGGLPTSCHEAVRQENGVAAIKLGDRMVAVSEAMARVFHLLALYAPTPEPVLLLGESGTGKELAARAIHDLGRGPKAPFVVVNMAAIPADLAEAELFGWVRGAFTGAAGSRAGAFEAAGEGTLFLDEIGDASPSIQAKILRAVESGSVTRIGSDKPAKVRARIVAATNHDLSLDVREGRFRLDLLQRLSCLVLSLPPLRDRREDIPVIAASFCGELPGTPRLSPGASALIMENAWPGNARELRNVIRRASVFTLGHNLTQAVVAQSLSAAPFPLKAAVDFPTLPARVTRGHQIAMSGLPRSTFYYRLKRGRIAAA
ncbi:MAG: sigma-54-dependent Fis family transcriptional regulator [Deltaproteobacteria bacterium]|nr:sigma-54-dependent Fis family transcriptional regulator [Deltaproteobacteria bacterium]